MPFRDIRPPATAAFLMALIPLCPPAGVSAQNSIDCEEPETVGIGVRTRSQSRCPINGLPANVRPVAEGASSALDLLDDAMRLSPTFRGLVRELEHTDVVALVERRLWANCARAFLQLIRAGADGRIVRILVCARHPPDEQMAWLGHELQHALEIAHATEAHATGALVDHLSRLGWQTDPRRTTFETTAAVRTGRIVLAEVRETLSGSVKPNRFLSDCSGQSHLSKATIGCKEGSHDYVPK